MVRKTAPYTATKSLIGDDNYRIIKRIEKALMGILPRREYPEHIVKFGVQAIYEKWVEHDSVKANEPGGGWKRFCVVLWFAKHVGCKYKKIGYECQFDDPDIDVPGLRTLLRSTRQWNNKKPLKKKKTVNREFEECALPADHTESAHGTLSDDGAETSESEYTAPEKKRKREDEDDETPILPPVLTEHKQKFHGMFARKFYSLEYLVEAIDEPYYTELAKQEKWREIADLYRPARQQ